MNRTEANFRGVKAQWLPLYKRLVARLCAVGGVEIEPLKTTISIVHEGSNIGSISARRDGLQLLVRVTRRARRMKRIARIEAADEEVLAWLKAAKHAAHTSKR